MNDCSRVEMGKLTRREFRQRMAAGELAGCILPLGATEQHLEHLAMEHDWRSACYVASAVATRLAPRILVAPGLMVGISEHHMNHPGTLTVRAGTFLAVLEDMIDSVVRAGFKNVVVLNAHGGNIDACQAVWPQLQRRFKINLHFLSYFSLLTADDAQELLNGGKRIPEDLPGHAQEFETAIALAAFPENVRTDMWTDQADRSPSLATREQGAAFLSRVVDRVSQYVTETIDGRRVAEIPPCFP